MAFLPASRATTIFTLTQDACTGTCGVSPFGTIALVQTTSTLVTVTETLAANERFVGGGAGDALEVNAVGPVTIVGITPGFAIGPPASSGSAIWSFLECCPVPA